MAGKRTRAATNRAPNSHRGQQRATDVVLVRHRRSEQRHETVAGKLRHRTTIAAYLRYPGIEETTQQLMQFLRAEAFGEPRRIDNVAE